MPKRNLTMIRRDINRLNDLIKRVKEENPSLNAISPNVSAVCDRVNKTWQNYQDISVKGNKEIEERDSAINKLKKWIQKWRPVLLITVSGMDSNLEKLPSRGSTTDDLLRVADDMVKFINVNEETISFRESAIKDLGNGIESARKESEDVSKVLPVKSVVRKEYSDACKSANNVLIKALLVVKAIYGRTSPEYKQFISKANPNSNTGIDDNGNDGEDKN